MGQKTPVSLSYYNAYSDLHVRAKKQNNTQIPKKKDTSLMVKNVKLNQTFNKSVKKEVTKVIEIKNKALMELKIQYDTANNI